MSGGGVEARVLVLDVKVKLGRVGVQGPAEALEGVRLRPAAGRGRDRRGHELRGGHVRVEVLLGHPEADRGRGEGLLFGDLAGAHGGDGALARHKLVGAGARRGPHAAPGDLAKVGRVGAPLERDGSQGEEVSIGSRTIINNKSSVAVAIRTYIPGRAVPQLSVERERAHSVSGGVRASRREVVDAELRLLDEGTGTRRLGRLGVVVAYGANLDRIGVGLGLVSSPVRRTQSLNRPNNVYTPAAEAPKTAAARVRARRAVRIRV